MSSHPGPRARNKFVRAGGVGYKRGVKKGFVIKLAVSVLFLGMIAWSLRGESLAPALRRLDPAWALGSVGLSVAMVMTSCLKWMVLLRVQGLREPYGPLLKLYFIGYYFSCLLPSNVGGDLVRSYQTGKRTGSQSKAAVSIFLERITGYVCLLTLTLLAPLLLPALYRDPVLLATATLAAVLLGGLVALMFLRDPGGLARRLAGAMLPRALQPGAQKVIRAAESFRARLLDALKALRGHAPSTAAVIVLTLLFYAMTWVNVWAGYKAFGHDLPFTHAIAVTPVCLMIASLPVAPFGGLGLTEGGYLYFFTLAAVPRPETFAMALLLRLKVLLLGIAGMLCYTFARPDERELPQPKP